MEHDGPRSELYGVGVLLCSLRRRYDVAPFHSCHPPCWYVDFGKVGPNYVGC